MKPILCLLFSLILVFPLKGKAQQQPDSFLLVKLPEVEVKDTRLWKSDTDRYHFNQTRYYVKTILPYLEAATKAFNELKLISEKKDFNKREKRRAVQEQENLLRSDFEEKLKALNETQGVLLVKLIARQTGVNIYSMLNEFKNPFTALKWQAWAKINGFNLNKKYRPENETLLEQVMDNLGYPLPDFYFSQGTASAEDKTD